MIQFLCYFDRTADPLFFLPFFSGSPVENRGIPMYFIRKEKSIVTRNLFHEKIR